MMARLYKVATFAHWDDYAGVPRKSPLITAYLRDYSPCWDGCIFYEVTTITGREAKRVATKMRRQHELSLDGEAS